MNAPSAPRNATLEAARFNMIEQQIRPWDVLDPRVLSTLGTVQRECFVPAARRALAFVDMEIPLGEPADAAVRKGQVMLAPRVEARLLQELQVQPHEAVLEIGTGSGHMAALLAHQAQRVVSYEIDADLARSAQQNLRDQGVTNAEVRSGDGAQLAASAWPAGSFDVVLLSGSVAEIPRPLLALLKPGGRLAAIVGEEPMMRATIVTCVADGEYVTRQPWDTVAPRLEGLATPAAFVF